MNPQYTVFLYSIQIDQHRVYSLRLASCHFRHIDTHAKNLTGIKKPDTKYIVSG